MLKTLFNQILFYYIPYYITDSLYVIVNFIRKIRHIQLSYLIKFGNKYRQIVNSEMNDNDM